MNITRQAKAHDVARVEFTINGVRVGQTRSRQQHYIMKLMERLASVHPGEEVHARYVSANTCIHD